MNADQIQQLCQPESFPDSLPPPELIETHISWIILTDAYAYKIKKPLTFSFLDFSTLEHRKYFCHREVELNQRLTTDIYLDVQPIVKIENQYRIGHITASEYSIIDYAVRMRRVDPALQMDRILDKEGGTQEDMCHLADKVAAFHQEAVVIRGKDTGEIFELFEDLRSVRSFLNEAMGSSVSEIIDQTLHKVKTVIPKLQERMQFRSDEGYVRDVHGDLHTGNIFLLDDPQPFDCIEYNDDFRQIDVLDEIAFLCMDLDYYNRPELAKAFLKRYLDHFPAMETSEDERLFTFYKCYRANVRAKVTGIQARNEKDLGRQEKLLESCLKYLKLMEYYLSMLD